MDGTGIKTSHFEKRRKEFEARLEIGEYHGGDSDENGDIN